MHRAVWGSARKLTVQFKSVCSGVADSSGLLLSLALDSQAEHLEPNAPLPGRFKDLDSRYPASSRPTKKKIISVLQILRDYLTSENCCVLSFEWQAAWLTNLLDICNGSLYLCVIIVLAFILC